MKRQLFITSFLIVCALPVFASEDPRPYIPARETRQALLKAHVDSLPLGDSTIKWLNKRFEGTVKELVLSDAHFWRLDLMRNPLARAELETFLRVKGLRFGMTELEVQNYVRNGKFAAITDQSSIHAFGFTLRTLHPLIRAKILTAGDLRKKSDQELLALPGIGETNLNEIRSFLVRIDEPDTSDSPDCSKPLTHP